MIRKVRKEDAKQIAAIYNEYVLNGTQSFETEPLSDEDILDRMAAISSRFPYYVYEENSRIAGFCYAHLWKERAAYGKTLETTVYLSPEYKRRGIGTKLMEHLIEACRKQGYKALIACITGENEESQLMHEKLGFRQVSRFEKVGIKFGTELDVVDYELLLSE